MGHSAGRNGVRWKKCRIRRATASTTRLIPRLLGCKRDIKGYLAANPGGRFDADFLNVRGTMESGRRGNGGWTWTRNKRFIAEALQRNQEIRLVTDPDTPRPAGGNTYQRELRYLNDRGYCWRPMGTHWLVYKQARFGLA